MNLHLLLFVTLAVVGILVLMACGGGWASPYKDKRTDIHFGYYGSYQPTANEAKDHTTFFWSVPAWTGLEQAIEDVRIAGKPVVLDLEYALFKPLPDGQKGWTFKDNPEGRLREMFQRMREAGVLHMVKVLCPTDEPNLPERNLDNYVPQAVEITKRVAEEFPELDGVKLGVIYYSRRPMQHMGLFDIVGFDDYENGANILQPERSYEQMRSQLRPDQKTWLIIGGSYGQDPEPFVKYAHANMEVWGIVAFIGAVPPWETTFKGIFDLPEMREKYIQTGKSLLP